MVGWGVLFFAEANQERRDPFTRSYQMPCDEQKQYLLMSLKAWQLKGIIKNSTNQQIWLFSEQGWLMVTFNGQLPYEALPKVLQPWQIVAISAESLSFRADLAPMCQQPINWTIKLLSDAK